VVVTPFGDLNLNDDIALRRWEDAHARRHAVYTRLTGTTGGQSMRGQIDADWMSRHWHKHVTLSTYLALNLSAMNQGLALPGKWRNEQELHDWNELHNRIHLKLDRQLKL
jgi:hypothetical protein